MAEERPCKYIFITGGVVSSIGKGIVASALGALFEARRLSVTLLKLDPYLNSDAGKLSPEEHGEVYVTEDGGQTDLDLGNYERFTHANITSANSISMGSIHKAITEKEANNDYGGKTVQVIPHVTDEIIRRIKAVGENSKADVVIVEVGGTVGDIECNTILEAVSQFIKEAGFYTDKDYRTAPNAVNAHLTYLPYIKAAGELKTKPTQHSVSALRSRGIQPSLLLCRCDEDFDDDIRDKLSLFCGISKDSVIPCLTSESLYTVPLQYHSAKLDTRALFSIGYYTLPWSVAGWSKVEKALKYPTKEGAVAIVSEYTANKDAYQSLEEALVHAGFANSMKVNIEKIDANTGERFVKGNQKDLLKKKKKSATLANMTDDELASVFEDINAIIIPGGFAPGAIEGKIRVAQYAREHNIPFLGVSLGMQIAMIEFARNVLDLAKANSTEFDAKTPAPIFMTPAELKGDPDDKRPLRLGAHPASIIAKDSIAARVYKRKEIAERHRHRYEFNPKYREEMEKAGFIVTAANTENNDLVEIAEIPSHPWFVGVLFHPEFKSKPFAAHPLFADFIRVAFESQKALSPAKKSEGAAEEESE